MNSGNVTKKYLTSNTTHLIKVSQNEIQTS
jgi:hypothetical protein